MRSTPILASLLVLAAATACSKRSASEASPSADQTSEQAPGAGATIAIDGSSTVFPITEAVAEEFQKQNPARVTIGVSGTGGGFKKLCKGEVAVSGASRPIKPSEVDLCKQNNVDYVELPVAYDGIAVVIHPTNDWASTMTVAELKRLWEPDAQGKITKWNQIRPEWPDKEIHLFGAGVDSGTYDYFTAAVVGTEHASRGDFTSSEDDNVLVQGIGGDPLALGFFGFAYFHENEQKLKAVAIDDGVADNGTEAVKPTFETIEKGTYQPLSRPIFIYVNKAMASRPEVKQFVDYYLGEGTKLVKEAGYVALPARGYELVRARFANGTTGSVFHGEGSKVGVSVEALLAGE